MSYSYEDYVNYYKYYYGDQYGTYYAQQAAAAAGVQAPPPPGATTGAPPQHMVAPPPPAQQNYSYPPPPSQPAAKAVSYPPPAAYTAAKRSWSEGGGGGGHPYPKKAKKPPVPSVTCAICDVTVSSEQVYLTHIAGKAHKKKAEKMKKEETRARSAPNSGSAAEQSASATAAAAAASLAASLPPQPAGTGIIISGGAGGPATPADAAAAAAAAAATAVTLTPPEKPKKGKKNRNSKKRLGFGSVGGAAAGADSSTPAEQLTFKCELCNVTVNSQQQLDLHLTGIKHKKTVRKLSNSGDPEVQRKLKESAELAAKAEERKAKENGNGMNPDLPDPVPSVAAASTDTTPQPNLPPGYVFIPAATAESGKDTYLCSACQHYSSDLFSLNAHVSSPEHQAKSAQQERPLGVPVGTPGTQAKGLVGQKTNFNLGAKQTSNAHSWKANMVPPAKKIMPLSSSFVAASSAK